MRRLVYFGLLFFSILTLANSAPIQTLEPGVLTVAVSSICKTDEPHQACWAHRITSDFAKAHNLTVKFKEVHFDQSWRLAGDDQVDIVATGITPTLDRNFNGSTFTRIYGVVKRGLKIKAENSERFHSLQDFVGFKVAAVEHMTSEIDLRHRTIKGVELVLVNSWDALYKLLENDEVQAIAEGYYLLPDADDVNQTDEYKMIDEHDLIPGVPEGLRFLVRDKSANLLHEFNAFIREHELVKKLTSSLD